MPTYINQFLKIKSSQIFFKNECFPEKTENFMKQKFSKKDFFEKYFFKKKFQKKIGKKIMCGNHISFGKIFENHFSQNKIIVN